MSEPRIEATKCLGCKDVIVAYDRLVCRDCFYSYDKDGDEQVKIRKACKALGVKPKG